MTDLAKLVVRLEAENGKYVAALDQANRKLSGFAKDQDALFGKLAATFAGFFTVRALDAWGDRILGNADNMGKLSERTGIAVEELSKLQYAFEQQNVSGESLTTMLRKLNQNLAEAAGNAKSEAAQAFRALGIDVKTSTGEVIKADVALNAIADKFANYADGANKSAIATKLLGKTGEEAIPALNGGSEALRVLGDEAVRVGRVITEDLAKAADEFNDRADRLKTTLIDGVGNRIAAELLPVLNRLGREFEETANQMDGLDRISRGAALAVKVLTDAGLSVAHVFGEVGAQIGAAGAIIVQAVQGNFAQVGAIIKERNAEALANDEAFQKRLAAIWSEGGAELLEEVQTTAKRIKAEAPNLAGGKALEEAATKSIDKLKQMAQQLDEQVATFGMGEAAVLKYRLEMGELADEVKAAGAAGQELAASIVAQSEALEKLKNAKEVADALADVNAQIMALQGNTADAAIAEFDAKNFELVKKLRAEGNTEGLKQLDTLAKLITAQADFNELNQEASRIQADLSRTEDRIRASREAGAITELQMQQQLGDAREKTANDLQAIAAAQEKIAAQTGNPAMLEDIKNLEAGVEQLRTQTDLLGQSMRANFEENLGDALKMAAKNVHDVDDAIRAFFDNLFDQLLTLATQNIAQQIGGAIGGNGGGTNWFNVAAGLFGYGGGKAAGGDVMPGMAYKVNEKTPNSEWFVPTSPGQIVPAEKMMGRGMQVVQHFSIEAPRGTVTRQTESQIGASAARSLSQANRRNN